MVEDGELGGGWSPMQGHSEPWPMLIISLLCLILTFLIGQLTGQTLQGPQSKPSLEDAACEQGRVGGRRAQHGMRVRDDLGGWGWKGW